MRRNQWTCSAESVQGNAGAEVTFHKVTMQERREWVDGETTDMDFLTSHLVDWHGIEDDEGNEIPSPKDEPGVEARLYLDEIVELIQLLVQGPGGEHALKN